MTVRSILATGMLLASTMAWAQAGPEAEKTTETLECELSGTCADPVAAPTEQAAPDVAGATVRTGSRGFMIAPKVSAPASVPARAAPHAPLAPTASAASDFFRIERNPNALAAGKGGGLPEWRADLHVSFVTGSAQLTEAGRREAQKFASALGTPLLAGMRFTIEGHTDTVGARAFNVGLSRRRAQAVVDFLVSKGAEQSRFNVVGYGFDRPLDGRAASDPANRRVEVVLVK